MYPCHSQTMDWAVIAILFIKFPNLQFHIDPVIDSVYITGTCHFRLYFFFCKDFGVPLSHPLFDPAAPFIVIQQHQQLHHSLYHLSQFPLSLDDDDPSEALDSSSASSSGPDDSYALVDPGMANGFLSSESMQRSYLLN